jgi:pantothenate synthetase
MENFNSIQDYREKKYTGQFFHKPGLAVSRGVFHEGLAAVLRGMVSECDSRTLVVAPNIGQSFADWQRTFNKDDLLNRLKPFNLDYVIFVSENESYMFESELFKVSASLHWKSYLQYIDTFAFFYIQLFNIFKPKHFFVGQKDFFEAKLVADLIFDLSYDVGLQVVEHARNTDGILYSSSLIRVSQQFASQVQVLSRTLQFVQRMLSNGQKEVSQLSKLISEFVTSFSDFELENVVFLDAFSLTEVRFVESEKKVIIQISGKIDGLEFKDNIIV